MVPTHVIQKRKYISFVNSYGEMDIADKEQLDSGHNMAI
jgi:hypothetical protein